jgi:cysteinyl-tRNA synthetase
VLYISDIIERGYESGDVRLYFMQAHYRSFHDFSRAGLEAARKSRVKLRKKLANYDTSGSVDQELVEFLIELLADDLQTPQMLSRLF